MNFANGFKKRWRWRPLWQEGSGLLWEVLFMVWFMDSVSEETGHRTHRQVTLV